MEDTNIDSIVRPKTLSAFYQCSFKDKILGVMKSGVKNHSYLHYGPPGTGKTTAARAIANYLFTGTLDGEYDLDSSNCYYEINAPQYSGVNEMRDLMIDMHQPPLYGNKVVLVIDEAHKLTKDAQSVLLKPLEEPPEHLYIIICTTDLGKIDKAIKDRPLKIEFDYPKAPITYITGYASPKITEALKKDIGHGPVPPDMSPEIAKKIMESCTEVSYRSLVIKTYEYLTTGSVTSQVVEESKLGTIFNAIFTKDRNALKVELAKVTEYEEARIGLINYINFVMTNNLITCSPEQVSGYIKAIDILKGNLEYSNQKADFVSRCIKIAMVWKGVFK